jgi:drug/metabolite transporter (DMT)-like permease
MVTYVALILVCCFMYGASAVLCKYALQRRGTVVSPMSWRQKILAVVTNKIWLIGVALSASANLIIIQVQSLADLSIVYPILNFAYIFALILGYFFLDELLTREQWLGVATTVAGTVILLFVEDPSTGQQTDITHLAVISSISTLLIAGLVLSAWKDRRQIWEVYYAICAGIAFGNVEIFLKATTNMTIAEIGHFSVFSWESVLGLMTVWPFFILMAFGVIGFIFMQIAYSHGDVSVSVPLITMTQRPVTLFSGYFAFGEAFPLIKIIGILTILLGVVVITHSTIRKSGSPQVVSVTG